MRRPLLLSALCLAATIVFSVPWSSVSITLRPTGRDEIVFDSNLELLHAPRRLRSGQLYTVNAQYRGHWTAYLASDMYKVPIYRSWQFENERGYFVVPKSGEYELIFRTWAPMHRQDVDTEPSYCREMRQWKPKLYAHDIFLLDSWPISKALWTYCEIASFTHIVPQPLGPANRTSRKLKFSGAGSVDVESLRSAVYEGYEEVPAARGLPTLGYWAREAEYTASNPMRWGSDRHECSIINANAPEQCQTDYQPFRWRTLVGRELGDLQAIDSCLAGRQIAIFGDSLAGNLWLGAKCQLGATQQAQTAAIMCGAQVAELALFSPHDIGLGIGYSDFQVILTHCQKSAGKPITDMVYQLGSWGVSHVPASEWSRGLQRLAQYAARHQAETGVRHFFSTVTPVNVQDDIHTFTSPQRVFAWNQKLFAVAAQHGIPVIDTWAPLDAREDGRIDRVHFCAQVLPEWAAQVLGALCGEETTTLALPASS